jgi:phytoene desaturase
MYILVSHLEKAFGVHYAMGGVAAIARPWPGDRGSGRAVRHGAEVDEILLEGARHAGVRLAVARCSKADIVVSNADAGHTYDRLLRNHPSGAGPSRS